MDNIYNLDLLKILPSSISEDKNVQAAAKALTPELQSVSRDIREALIISRIDELPEPVLDLLAWQWHVDFYEPERLPIALKRNLIKNSIPWHRKKGTPWAVKQILRDLGLEPVIREWFDIPGARPYTFAIDAKYAGNPADILTFLGEDTLKLLRLAVEVTKPVRSDLLYIVVIPDIPGLDPSEHGCRYDFCMYEHGLLPGLELGISDIENGIDGRGNTGSILRDYSKSAYAWWIAWDAFRYGGVLPKVKFDAGNILILGTSEDRDAFEGHDTWIGRNSEWNNLTWVSAEKNKTLTDYLFVVPIAAELSAAPEFIAGHTVVVYAYSGLDGSLDISSVTEIGAGTVSDAWDAPPAYWDGGTWRAETWTGARPVVSGVTDTIIIEQED